MTTRKLLVRVAWTRRGIDKFTDEVNTMLAKGWEPIHIDLDRRLVRTLCMALLSIPTRCDCQCSCCTGQGSHDENCDCACDCCVIHSHQAAKSSEEK